MPLIPREGSYTPPASQTSPQTPVDVTDVLNQAPFIKNAQLHRTAFNPETFNEEFQTLQGYLDGARVTVQYFNLETGGKNRRTDAIDASSVRNTINTKYTCISNYEITLTGEIATTTDTETNETLISGEAITYAGMNPNIGDVFIFALTNGQSAQFVVDSVERLSIRQGSNHKITFVAREFATTESVQLLLDSSVDIMVFDKTTYLSTTSSLLTTAGYAQLQTLRQMRVILIKYYYTNFFDKAAATILSPTGSYDPYMNKFLNAKVSISDVGVRSTQYPLDDLDFYNSIWARFLDVWNMSVTDLFTTYQTFIQLKHYTDVYITTLINKAIVKLDRGSTIAAVIATPSDWTNSTYIFSQAFYDGITTGSGAMSALELVVYGAIQTKMIADIPGLINNYLNSYQSLDTATQYYNIPIYLFLIDLAIATVTKQPAGADLS